MAGVPEDSFLKSQQFTKTIYRDQYPSIDPSSAKLAQTGKVIVITGANKGLGRRAFAAAFAKAGPKAMVLVARNASELSQVGDDIRALNSKVQVLEVSADVTSEESIKALWAKVKENFGSADVLVNNAGTFVGSGTLAEAPPKEWWRDFEVNVKGTFLATQGFLKQLDASKPATIINLTSAASIPVLPGISSYALSKLITFQLCSYVAAENPNVACMALAPGVVMTDMTTEAFKPFAQDTPELVGGVAVWLATEEAKFMSGRFISANWMVDELVQRKEEIVKEGKLLFGLVGRLGADQFE
ncbi:hypothetical protein MMC24_007033 [Lignoscripta atroalba]|nr:hypothetical protein [Lignoscripta atroalba]